jgi:hypothetical protein
MKFKILFVLSLVLVSFRSFSADDEYIKKFYAKTTYFSEKAEFFGTDGSYHIYLNSDLIKKVITSNEISIVLPRKFQNNLSTCASCASSVLYQWYYCKKNKIKDCSALGPDYQVSTFFMKQFSSNYYFLKDSDVTIFQKAGDIFNFEILKRNSQDNQMNVVEFMGPNFFDLSVGSISDNEFYNLKFFSSKNPKTLNNVLSEVCTNTNDVGSNYSSEEIGGDVNLDLKTIRVALAEQFFILSRYYKNNKNISVLQLKKFCSECFEGIKQIASKMLSKNLLDENIFQLTKTFSTLYDYEFLSKYGTVAIPFKVYNSFVANKIIATIILFNNQSNCYFKGKLDANYIISNDSQLKNLNKNETLNVIVNKIDNDTPVTISVCAKWKKDDAETKCSIGHQIIISGYRKIVDINGNQRYLFKVNECSNNSSQEWFLADTILDNTMIEMGKPRIFWIE